MLIGVILPRILYADFVSWINKIISFFWRWDDSSFSEKRAEYLLDPTIMENIVLSGLSPVGFSKMVFPEAFQVPLKKKLKSY